MWRVHVHKLSVYLWLVLVLSFPNTVCPCGEAISGRKGELKTPNYPDDYDNNLNCTWIITVDTNYTITVIFKGFYLEEANGNACMDHFYVYDGPSSSSAVILHACGDERPMPIISSGNSLTFALITNDMQTRTGFKLIWTVSDKFTLHTNPVSWPDAHTACLKEDGYLAVMSEWSEPSLKQLLTNISGSVWFGDYITPWVWLKGCYKFKDGTFIPDKNYNESKQKLFQTCTYQCQDNVYFGLQGRKCFCLTSEDMDYLVLSKPVEECTMSCSGDSDLMCGGDSALTVFMTESTNPTRVNIDNGELCRVFWTNGSGVFYDVQSCSEEKSYACFTDVKGSSLIRFTSDPVDFHTAAWRRCQSLYGLADYRLFSKQLRNSTIMKDKPFWIGSLRKGDNTKDKESVPSPSICKTIKHVEDGLQTENQTNCELQFEFVCQTAAILCGEKLVADDGYINWPVNEPTYNNNENCQWQITVSEGSSLNMTFLNVNLEASDSCSFDFIEVSETSANGPKRLDKLCGNISNVMVSSSHNAVRIRFKSDSDTTGSGFQLRWWSELTPTTTMTTPIQTSKPGLTSTLHNSQRVTNLDDDTNYSLGGGAIAGIVAGGMFIIIVVIALAVLILRHRKSVNSKQEPIELQRSIHPNNDTSLSDANLEAVYSKPVPKESRKSNRQSLEQPSGDLYYDHLNQGLKPNASQHDTSNTYDKLPTDDVYDHTTQAPASVMGEEYEHLGNKKKGPRLTERSEYNTFENTTKQPEKGSNDYDYFVQETTKADDKL